MQLPSGDTSCMCRFWFIKKLSTSVRVEGGADTGTRDVGTVMPGSVKFGVAIACVIYKHKENTSCCRYLHVPLTFRLVTVAWVPRSHCGLHVAICTLYMCTGDHAKNTYQICVQERRVLIYSGTSD